MKTFESIGIQIPSILLPRPDIDMQKWAVIACDQHTSQPEYWHQVENFIGDAPSTLKLVLPEVYLEQRDVAKRIEYIQHNMQTALDTNLFVEYENLILIERTVENGTRLGVVLALDLERYDYSTGSGNLIRATEGTIIERLPPRIRIRSGAALELPHILVLIDDPNRTVIEPLAQHKERLKMLYDFDLMFDSGHLTGYAVQGDEFEGAFISALESIAQVENFSARYNVPRDTNVLLFAMGDGNHSLATAKAYWEQIKKQVGPNHPARYALVEIVNIHDKALRFEPIHRILFNLKKDIFAALYEFFGSRITYESMSQPKSVLHAIKSPRLEEHCVGVVNQDGFGVLRIRNPKSNLPVGSLQAFLDDFLDKDGANKIDYVHGDDVVTELGSKQGNIGFYLPPLGKSDLFRTVILDGSLPRKTFSLGEAHEKRFYVESRKIVPQK